MMWKKKALLAVAVVVAVSGLSSGCSRGAREAKESRDPLVRKARDLRADKDIDGAVKMYNQAIAENPDSARAHLEVAALYDQERRDFLRAIYHYQRYLELDPETEKKGQIEGLIRRCQLEYGATLPEKPTEVAREVALLQKERELLVKRIKDLDAENTSLRTEMAALKNPAQPVTQRASTGTVAVAVQPAGGRPPVGVAVTNAPPRRAAQAYTVQRGDRLASIARRFGISPDKIYEANRGTMKTRDSIKQGQVLTIPAP